MDGSCASSSWTLVRPSACSPSRPPPSRFYHSRNISTDEPHVVLNSPDGGGDGVLRVFLPGTGSNPLQYSCLLRAIASIDGPVIGLSYAFLPAADAQRNVLCASIYSLPAAIARCLAHQHSDALFGGSREPQLWPPTDHEDSVQGRLSLLLRSLASGNAAWSAYLDADGTTPLWERVWIGGHSQGAGHAAYLAATVALAGATLLSGPQDACLGCRVVQQRLWLDERAWATRGAIHALAHANESAAEVIQENWVRMATSGGLVGWSSSSSEEGGVAYDIGFGLEVPSNSNSSPWITRVRPSNLLRCGGRPYHCSTAKDSTTPIASTLMDDGGRKALYELAVWPRLWQADAAALPPSSPPPSTIGASIVAVGLLGVVAGAIVGCCAAVRCGRVCRRLRKRPATRPVVREIIMSAAAARGVELPRL